jgi:peptidoglycan/xylan/chitin deacetylase (PgdA/CDA1 family)
LLIAMACLLLLGNVFMGMAAAFGWGPLSIHGGRSQSLAVQRQISTTQKTPVSLPPSAVSLIEGVTQRFMDAMLQKNWSSMWSVLHPDAQRSWQGKRDFIHFEQVKFGPLHLTAYATTSASIHASWRNPDTTLVYAQAATLSVSLQATAPQGLLTGPASLALSHGLLNRTLFALAQYHNAWQVLVAGPADADAPILVPRTVPAVKLLVPIFMYHHVSNQPTFNLLDYNLTVTTSDFEQQLTWLQQQGYQSINQTELFDALYYGNALPAHPMILTFDDGYEDVYTNALPALLAHHYRGVFYIITGMHGGSYMTWNQVRTLAQQGMQVSSHTVHHVNVGNPPAWTSTQMELTNSKQTLETLLGQPVQFFCYPSGEPFHHDTLFQQQSVLADLFKDGYVGATLDPFSFFSTIQSARTPYLLNRIRVSGGEDLMNFAGILNVTLRISM